MRQRRLFYGWFDPNSQTFRLSSLPPDSPVRPSLQFATASEVTALADRRKADVMWSPPLTRDQQASLSR